MRLLVLGSNGLVGSNVLARARARDWSVAGTYRSDAPDVDVPLARHDVREAEEFERLVERHRPDAVVNCAALTDVDACEKHPKRAHRINGTAPGDLAGVCSEREVGFVHCSTDYVFDGETETPYAEAAPPNPVQSYGASKLRGERTVRRSHEEALIVRLSFVYGCHGVTGELTGFPAWVRDRRAANGSIPLFTDQHVTPSRAGSAAETILNLLDRGDRGCSGTYHVASRSCVTPYAFGETIERYLDSRGASFARTTLSAVDRRARRPRYTCLDVERVERTVDCKQPTLAEDVASIADELAIT